ncbi:MAG TPA: dihydropteroate synthase [Gemmataceae bacterium]|nr:dihydropteroate synthase [Gemmataceae bacterium]
MLEWQLPDRVLRLDGRALVMGIVNVTPDSFSDGGRFAAPEAAVAHALDLVGQGADILDVGGESSRPGAEPVAEDEELRRVLPVVRELAARTTLPLSVDTTKASVADACLAAGAHVINDITALLGDPDMARVAAARRAGVVLMHMRGTPQTMQIDPHYEDVAAEVCRFLEERLHAAAAAGIEAGRVVLDPGIGFGKTTAHNLELLARLGEIRALGRPVLLGVSRKGFSGKLLGRGIEGRLAASLAAACHAVTLGSAQVIRAHDVRETRDAVTLLAAIALSIRETMNLNNSPATEERGRP